jgi:hypothetical protein
MSESPRTPRESSSDEPRRRDHLSLVVEAPIALAPGELPVPAQRPRTIGRLIAQTALIADSAVNRRRLDEHGDGRGMAGRLLGRFR